MFRTVRLPIIRSLFTVHSTMVYVLKVYRQLTSRTMMELQFHPGPARKLYDIVYSVQWVNSWWWTDELSETCTVSCQNTFVKLMHMVGFIIKKFVTMYSHTNVVDTHVINNFKIPTRLKISFPRLHHPVKFTLTSSHNVQSVQLHSPWYPLSLQVSLSVRCIPAGASNWLLSRIDLSNIVMTSASKILESG
jgi:hypothetical protein